AWGVEAVPLPEAHGTDAIIRQVIDHVEGPEGLERGDLAVAVMGGADDPVGATTLIHLVTV
ncbi:MAG: pyruvate kinase, partial [Planctomycetota bacterium]